MILKRTLVAAVTLLVISGTTKSYADTFTKWGSVKNQRQLNNYLGQTFGRRGTPQTIYPVGVECRQRSGGLQIRMLVRPIPAKKPFHKWNIGLTSPRVSVAAAVSRFKVSDRREWQYKAKYTCAVQGGNGVVIGFRGPGI